MNGQKRVIENRKFGWRFFGPALARSPYPLNFAEAKPAGTIRIFVFGESAAYGDPQPDFGMPRVLEVLLRERYPNVHFEVINAAMVAINSHAILPIARDCAPEHGDIWLVYMGNNEVVGPFGSGTIFGPQVPPLPLIRASLALKSTRTGELVSALVAGVKGGADSAQWRGMMMFVQHQVRQDSPRMTRTYSQFKQNLADIVRAGTDSGAKVIVSTVASNLKDCAPFASQHSRSLTGAQSNEWNRLYQEGIEAEAETNASQAINCYEQAAKIDGHFADLQFRWARMCLFSRNENAAREHFILARDYDTLRFRTDSHLNAIIRDFAAGRANQGVYFLDAAEGLARQSPHGICGKEFFYEHVHFTFEGDYALARMFADKIAGVLPPEISRQAHPLGTWMTADECAQRLGWNDWSKHQVLESLQINVPPFNFQLNHAEMLERINESKDQLAQRLTPEALRETADHYRQLISAMPTDWVFYKELAEVLEQLNEPAAAADCWAEVEKLIPQSPVAPLSLHLILLNEGKLEQAADEYEKALKLDKNLTEGTYANWLNTMGGKALENGGAAAALSLFQKAINLRPNFAEAHIGLGTSLEAIGKMNEARAEFRVALRHPPTTPVGLVSLGKICYQQGWTNEAIQNLEAALNFDPTDSTAHSFLGAIYFEQQKESAALEQFQEALRWNPRNATAQNYLDRLRTNQLDARKP